MDGNKKPERKSWVKTFFAALLECFTGDIFDCLPESLMGGVSGLGSGLVALAAVAAVLYGVGIFLLLFYGLFAVTYQLILDPDAVHVAARLDSLSINPDKCFPRS